MRERKKNKNLFFNLTACTALAIVMLFSIGCNITPDFDGILPEDPNPVNLELSAENQLLDDTFRIDISDISVVFNYYPLESYTTGHAVVTFRMRPGQQRPVIHFDPAVRGNAVSLVRLNGETLAMGTDVAVLEQEGTSQKALLFRRDLAENTDHTIEMEYRVDLAPEYPRFSSEVHDIRGRGNEEIFPTLNTPHEFARHRLTFRVHGDLAYNFVGSGLVQQTSTGPVQEWTLDTEREIASYTVMFVLLPADHTAYEERTINGTDVRVVAFSAAQVEAAFEMMEMWLPHLEADFGPFPMPRGYSIFITNYGGGMEYYGGTMSTLGALMHETVHMYFACSTVAKTYRDSWMDEAIVMWYLGSFDPSFAAIPSGYTSNLVSGRQANAVGFDSRAYYEGAAMMEAVARELGGRAGMVNFLAYVHENYTFAPFTTRQFLDYLIDFSGIDMHTQFDAWAYSERATAPESVQPATVPVSAQEVNMSPPDSVKRKFQGK